MENYRLRSFKDKKSLKQWIKENKRKYNYEYIKENKIGKKKIIGIKFPDIKEMALWGNMRKELKEQFKKTLTHKQIPTYRDTKYRDEYDEWESRNNKRKKSNIKEEI